MKILLSAYACEPNRGSEQGVGWGWATELAKTNDVWVLTRDRNQKRIEKYLNEHPEYQLPGLHFIYVGVSKKLTFWKKGNRGIRIYYMLWQKAAYKAARKWNEKIGFQCVQHVTFVSYTQPTYLYKLGIPLIWGPVSGGENIPKEISIKMTAKEKLIETVRKCSQTTALWMPSIRRTMEKSTLILAATEETKKRIPKRYKNKTYLLPAIGLETVSVAGTARKGDEKFRIVMAGRLIYWKAFDIGINAFKALAKEFPYVELHILGEGTQKLYLKKLAGEYLDTRIFFHNPVAHDHIYDFYAGYNLFLNTTLRDSGCMTMMEAMAVGLPCIAIATGGPKVLASFGNVDLVEPSTYYETVEEIASRLKNAIVYKETETDNTKISGLTYMEKVDTVMKTFCNQLEI